MPRGLQRHYGTDYLHFITFSCYQLRALLGAAAQRDSFLCILEQTRQAYHLVVVGYVVMPEHVHLLISEPERADPSVVVQVIKQRFAQDAIAAWRAAHPGQPWAPRSLWPAS